MMLDVAKSVDMVPPPRQWPTLRASSSFLMATADDEGKLKLRMVLPQEILLRKGWPSHINTSFLSKKAGLPAARRPTFSRNQIIGPCYAGPGGIVGGSPPATHAGGSPPIQHMSAEDRLRPHASGNPPVQDMSAEARRAER